MQPADSAAPDPDISLHLTPLNGTADVGLYCNPGWGANSGSAAAQYPQPLASVWRGNDLGSGAGVGLNISRNDRLYAPPGARNRSSTAHRAYRPSFICAVREEGHCLCCRQLHAVFCGDERLCFVAFHHPTRQFRLKECKCKN